MKIANALYGNWKAELEHYLQLYNDTPHTITGKSPSELLQNRKLRSKMPQLEDLETTPPSSDFRDKDHALKMQGKEREDQRRRAKASEISIGDTVLMKNLLPTNKLATNFLDEKFVVIDRRGTNVTIQSKETGRIYDRNTAHLKLLPTSFGEEASSNSNPQDDLQLKSNSTQSEEHPEQPPAKLSSTSNPIRRTTRVHKPAVPYSPSR